MKSKLTYDLDVFNRPIILAQISHSEDVRDKIATRFKEGFGQSSNLAVVSFWPDNMEMGSNINTLQIAPLPNRSDGLEELLVHISCDQLERLITVAEKELVARKRRQKKNPSNVEG